MEYAHAESIGIYINVWLYYIIYIKSFNKRTPHDKSSIRKICIWYGPYHMGYIIWPVRFDTAYYAFVILIDRICKKK